MAPRAEMNGGQRSRIPSHPTAISISDAVSRIHKQFVGRGPVNVRTVLETDLVVCLLEGGLTIAEQTLTGTDRQDIVVAGRAGLQQAMREALVAAIEGATGRRVRSVMSASDLERDLQAEIFVLASRPSPPAAS